MFFKECRDALLVQLAMPLNLSDLSKHDRELAASFREERPKRPRQLTKLRRTLIFSVYAYGATPPDHAPMRKRPEWGAGNCADDSGAPPGRIAFHAQSGGVAPG